MDGAERSISVSEHNPKNWFLEGRWGFYDRKGQMEASELLHTHSKQAKSRITFLGEFQTFNITIKGLRQAGLVVPNISLFNLPF